MAAALAQRAQGQAHSGEGLRKTKRRPGPLPCRRRGKGRGAKGLPLLTMLKESSIRPGDQSPEKGVPHVSTKKPLILVGILAILTAFLMAAYWPSTLPQVLGKDFAQLKEVQIHLSHVRDNSPSRDLTLSPDDPATGDLLALLEGQRYRPVYHNPWGAISGHPVALDYAIYGVFVFQGEDGGVSVPFYFDGYREVSIGSGGPFRKGYRLDPAVQQAVLDLLLAQPDTPA